MTTSNEEEFRYLSRSLVKHSFGHDIPTERTSARCGTGPHWADPDGWLGTGNQKERDRLAELKLCGRCRILNAKDRGHEQAARERLKGDK